jgi:hypothetical protein
MSQCTAIRRDGGRCKGVAIDASGLCYAHDPNRADARRRAAPPVKAGSVAVVAARRQSLRT